MVDTNPRIISLSAETLPTHDEIRRVEVPTPGGVVELTDDPYSDRIRCDHPDVDDTRGFGEALIDAADTLGRGRVVAMVDATMTSELETVGFEVEAVMPGFYGGKRDCAVMGTSDASHRMDSADLAAAQVTEDILANKKGTPGLHVAIDTERATAADAVEIAELLDETFAEYPTPSAEPAYIARQMRDGNVFRVVRRNDEIVACASADLVKEARTAELTDCATQPAHRGKGYMRAILSHLMEDLVAMGYPTAFTLARARIPGVNVAFQRCGFKLRGRMARSCRIGTGLEDMNVWSRHL